MIKVGGVRICFTTVARRGCRHRYDQQQQQLYSGGGALSVFIVRRINAAVSRAEAAVAASSTRTIAPVSSSSLLLLLPSSSSSIPSQSIRIRVDTTLGSSYHHHDYFQNKNQPDLVVPSSPPGTSGGGLLEPWWLQRRGGSGGLAAPTTGFSNSSSAIEIPDPDPPSSSSSSSNNQEVSVTDQGGTTIAKGTKKKQKKPKLLLDSNLRPSQVVAELDRHIVGQHDAKRAVAIAMRNRWRRQQLPDDLRKEVTPRNVLLVGPTGCGKTEVARRMAQLNDAPFIKVEATKFTEVGYHGRDVDQIIRDLMDVSMQLTRKIWTERLREQARKVTEERILDLLTGPMMAESSGSGSGEGSGASRRGGRESFRDMLQQGLLDDQEIEVEVPQGERSADISIGDGTNPSIVAMTDLWQRMSGGPGSKKHPMERKKLPISEAREVILEIELEKLLETVDLKKEAVTAAEESGIVFIDEIDKICSARDSFSSRSADASAEGVQRDLLPLIEGTTISTKYGNVNTDYILFVASGAFHAVKPSDLLPELQGRLPIRVELKGLTEGDLYRILTEPVANLIRQQVEMIRTEGVDLVFDDDAIREMARMAAELNRTVENIGARRLHTVMERIMDPLNFDAAEADDGTVLRVDKQLVQERLADFVSKTDLSRYIL